MNHILDNNLGKGNPQEPSSHVVKINHNLFCGNGIFLQQIIKKILKLI